MFSLKLERSNMNFVRQRMNSCEIARNLCDSAQKSCDFIPFGMFSHKIHALTHEFER
jgi:hypothetical protein